MQELKIISPMDKSLKTIIELMRSYYDEWYRMFIIDNLDKIRPNDREDENSRYQRVTTTLQDMKNESDMCIMLVHHAKKQWSMNSYTRAWYTGMRWSQKIIDNSTQIFEVYRDLDPDSPPERRSEVEIIQMKDSFEWNNGYETIYFNRWTYQEDDPNKPF
jgi:RecA-family ATPase